jgi:hypothetical protein
MWGENLAEARQAQQEWIRQNAIFLSAFAWKYLGRKGVRGAVRVRELADHERVGQGDVDVEIDAVPGTKIPGHPGQLRHAVDLHNMKQEFVVYFVWKPGDEELRSIERVKCSADTGIPLPPQAPPIEGGVRRNVSHTAKLNPTTTRQEP